MALQTRKAKRNVEREIVIKAGVSGFPDRTFIYRLTPNGRFEVREKGSRKVRRVSVETFIKWAVIHVQEQDS